MLGFLIGFATCYMAAGVAAAIREYHRPHLFPWTPAYATGFLAFVVVAWPLSFLDPDV